MAVRLLFLVAVAFETSLAVPVDSSQAGRQKSKEFWDRWGSRQTIWFKKTPGPDVVIPKFEEAEGYFCLRVIAPGTDFHEKFLTMAIRGAPDLDFPSSAASHLVRQPYFLWHLNTDPRLPVHHDKLYHFKQIASTSAQHNYQQQLSYQPGTATYDLAILSGSMERSYPYFVPPSTENIVANPAVGTPVPLKVPTTASVDESGYLNLNQEEKTIWRIVYPASQSQEEHQFKDYTILYQAPGALEKNRHQPYNGKPNSKVNRKANFNSKSQRKSKINSGNLNSYLSANPGAIPKAVPNPDLGQVVAGPVVRIKVDHACI